MRPSIQIHINMTVQHFHIVCILHTIYIACTLLNGKPLREYSDVLVEKLWRNQWFWRHRIVLLWNIQYFMCSKAKTFLFFAKTIQFQFWCMRNCERTVQVHVHKFQRSGIEHTLTVAHTKIIDGSYSQKYIFFFGFEGMKSFSQITEITTHLSCTLLLFV